MSAGQGKGAVLGGLRASTQSVFFAASIHA